MMMGVGYFFNASIIVLEATHIEAYSGFIFLVVTHRELRLVPVVEKLFLITHNGCI